MNIFVTGAPGCGKSTLIQQLIGQIDRRSIAGIVTPETRENGQRQGFKMVDLATGEEAVLASVDITPADIGKYGVNLEGIKHIVDIFLPSAEQADIIFLDEIGPMELRSPRFQQAVQQVLAMEQPVVATLHRRLVDRYAKHGEVIRLTRDTFNEVKQDILDKLTAG
ncbi:MAG: NTPase [Thermoplasmatota archaeon]